MIKSRLVTTLITRNELSPYQPLGGIEGGFRTKAGQTRPVSGSPLLSRPSQLSALFHSEDQHRRLVPTTHDWRPALIAPMTDRMICPWQWAPPSSKARGRGCGERSRPHWTTSNATAPEARVMGEWELWRSLVETHTPSSQTGGNALVVGIEAAHATQPPRPPSRSSLPLVRLVSWLRRGPTAVRRAYRRRALSSSSHTTPPDSTDKPFSPLLRFLSRRAHGRPTSHAIPARGTGGTGVLGRKLDDGVEQGRQRIESLNASVVSPSDRAKRGKTMRQPDHRCHCQCTEAHRHPAHVMRCSHLSGVLSSAEGLLRRRTNPQRTKGICGSTTHRTPSPNGGSGPTLERSACGARAGEMRQPW